MDIKLVCEINELIALLIHLRKDAKGKRNTVLEERISKQIESRKEILNGK